MKKTKYCICGRVKKKCFSGNPYVNILIDGVRYYATCGRKACIFKTKAITESEKPAEFSGKRFKPKMFKGGLSIDSQRRSSGGSCKICKKKTKDTSFLCEKHYKEKMTLNKIIQKNKWSKERNLDQNKLDYKQQKKQAAVSRFDQMVQEAKERLQNENMAS